MEMNSELITPQEAADILRVSRRTIIRLAHAGAFKKVQLGASIIRIDRVSFQEFVREATVDRRLPLGVQDVGQGLSAKTIHTPGGVLDRRTGSKVFSMSGMSPLPRTRKA